MNNILHNTIINQIIDTCWKHFINFDMHFIIFHLLISHFIFMVSCTTRGPYPQTCKHLCYQSLDPSKECYCKLGFDGYCCGHYQVCCTCNEFYECNEKKQACARFSKDAYFPKDTQTSRIQFGTKTDYLPFQVQLKIQKGNKFGRCGGVLISNHLVLTAYHCFKGIEIEKNHTVTTGVLTPTESSPHKQVRKVISVTKSAPIPPPQQKFMNDMAIVKLDQPFNLHQKYTFPACLPDHGDIMGSECFLSGWGKGSKHHLAVANFTIPEVPDMTESCSDGNNIQNPYKDYDDLFCAYAQDQLAGPGDSGGPFICEENGFAVLHGILKGGQKWLVDHKGAATNTYLFKHMEFIKMYMSANPDPCC